MIGVARDTHAGDFSVRSLTSCTCPLLALEHKKCTAFAKNHTISIKIERTHGLFGGIISSRQGPQIPETGERVRCYTKIACAC